MSLYINDFLKLVRDTRQCLKRYPAAILVDPQDYCFFRSRYKPSKTKAAIAPLKLPPPRIDPPTPPPAPQPAPKAVDPEQALPPPKPEPPKPEPPQPMRERAFSMQRWKTLFATIAPTCPILPAAPDDSLAKKISSRWKTKNQTAPITVLCYQEIAEHKILLEQITKALDIHFGPAKLASAQAIEQEKQWEAFLSVADLRLVICCDYTLWQLPALLQFYKEVPAQGLRQIGDKSLFLFPDLSLYLKNPLLKRSLWKALCMICDPALQPSSSTKT